MPLEIGLTVFFYEPINVPTAKLNCGTVEWIDGDWIGARHYPYYDFSPVQVTKGMHRKWIHTKEPRDPRLGWTDEERAEE